VRKSGLLVKLRGDAAEAEKALTIGFGPDRVEPVLTLPARAAAASDAALGIAAPQGGATWYRIRDPGDAHPWDAAHDLVARRMQRTAFAAASGRLEFVEPDIEQSWLPELPEAGAAFAAAPACTFHDQDGQGGKAVSAAGKAWNLQPAYSQLAQARSEVDAATQRSVWVAHLDTGYDPDHLTRPAGLDVERQRNFRDPARPHDATDRTPNGLTAFRNQGHGTATLALLAGAPLNGQTPAWPGFTEPLGGAPGVSVIPIRIADWVVRFSTGTMVQGFQHAVAMGADVLTMSMGGLSSSALADAVNLAYDTGIFMVTAAGNNIAGMPTPGSVVFPARFRRVLAACGVMADGRAYDGLKWRTMQGNRGPASKMHTALAGYTPNVPWAEFGCGHLVSMDGAGTSSATPQIAAAAALWIAQHRSALAAYPEAWMRVEAIRHALFSSALKTTAAMDEEEVFEKLGRGVLQAAAALDVRPLSADRLARSPEAEPSWSWLNLIVGAGGISLAPRLGNGKGDAMLALELTQMAQRVREVEAAVPDDGVEPDLVPAASRNRYLEAALDAGDPSRALRSVLERQLGRVQVAVPAALAVPQEPIKRRARPRPEPPRRLRVYALDPSIAQSLQSVAVNETVLQLPWEELKPGPVGEYVEVVDVDPASNRLYDPVDLNQPELLAQDGWTPSEGNPEFHQQMVYAVAMRTICSFEEALGRRALWAPRWALSKKSTGKSEFQAYEVPRLRIYPHALRAENAYYSPGKVALMFGYFQSTSAPENRTPDGSMVFSCLSSDIIAHEMTHALLDGLHRSFQEVSNPDVPAFHEAFADIVALFQHFAIPELVRHEIARAGARLDAAGLLGSLAQQFGEGIARGGPLRDYLAAETGKLKYPETMEVHARGSILVSAVYRAFLRIVDQRTADLIRLATNGTGVLPQVALHPDLVNRLADETCKSARHVLRICIRALDYCPAVDITFGEYLRALITADVDVVPEDTQHYRLAFMEAFRERGLLPRDVKTVSVETLAWGTLEDRRPPWLAALVAGLDFSWNRDLDRSAVWRLNEKNRMTFWRALNRLLAHEPQLMKQFGLLDGVPRYGPAGTVQRPAANGRTTFEVRSIRPARRIAPDGSFRVEVVANILQRRRVPVDPADPDGPSMWFRGGATLILDPRKEEAEVRYAIVKSSASETRLARQRATAARMAMSALRSLYFGSRDEEPFALLHANQHRGCHHA
jgi:subtilisin family serine protease